MRKAFGMVVAVFMVLGAFGCLSLYGRKVILERLLEKA